MKIKVTLMTENDVPVSELGENPEHEVERLWSAVVALLNLKTNPGEHIRLDRIEIIGD